MQASIYFHIPFCLSKCSYCDFTSFAHPEISPDSYVELLLEELFLSAKGLEAITAPTYIFWWRYAINSHPWAD